MKQIYSFIVLLFISIITYAQTEQYEFSIQYIGVNGSTGNYQFAFVATPDADVTNQLSSDMAAMVSVPAGYSIGNFENGTSGIPSSEFLADNYGLNSDAGDPTFYINRQVPTTNIFFNFTSGTPIQLVLFDIIGATPPTSGFLRLLPPGDGSRLGFLPDYINMTDGSTTTDRYGTQSTTENSYNFSTLGIINSELDRVSIYPNPVKNELNIKGFKNIDSVSITNISGQVIKQFTNSLEKLDLSDLSSGVYFVSISSQEKIKRIKIIKD
ncbi:T9SS type A sorting domain-containing protein [Aurantibacter aestuarii]|uniref:Secretion system C-terminal sorting domain-containing protein n=1 Tax=Aurantibacter aestuarii TaxID=1266046 RepID=A0A2T1NC47_9FLAO|nr:T9SS type A sorting domain-containing protein [Aurantibacter aestuarii]PSG90018.1 hypothetical protein C7H52_01740 [Aurantibacter aestuarii]